MNVVFVAAKDLLCQRWFREVAMQLSVVIPVHNEAENIGGLLQEIHDALDYCCAFEIIVVDDGSTDTTPSLLNQLKARFDSLRIVRHQTSCGQSTALMTGIDAAVAPIIATLDGDGQNDPANIPAMLTALQAAKPEDRLMMVTGFRKTRKDSWWRLFCSRVANGVRSRILGDQTPDTGCGIKVFYREAFLRMPRFNHMHRFMPALIIRGGGRVLSVPVNHRPRVHGRSHYGTLQRLIYGIVDLAGVAWLIRRNQLPVIAQMDVAHDERPLVDSIRFDGAAPVLRPIRRAVA